MRIRTIKSLLWATTGVFTAGTAVVCALSLKWNGSPAEINVPRTPAGNTGQIEVAALPSAAELRSHCQRDLRQALYDPPPPPPPVTAAPPPPPPLPQWILAGTVTEQGHSQALFVGPDGKLLFRKIGEQTEGAMLLEINRDNVKLRYQGQDVVLKVQKKG